MRGLGFCPAQPHRTILPRNFQCDIWRWPDPNETELSDFSFFIFVFSTGHLIQPTNYFWRVGSLWLRQSKKIILFLSIENRVILYKLNSTQRRSQEPNRLVIFVLFFMYSLICRPTEGLCSPFSFLTILWQFSLV